MCVYVAVCVSAKVCAVYVCEVLLVIQSAVFVICKQYCALALPCSGFQRASVHAGFIRFHKKLPSHCNGSDALRLSILDKKVVLCVKKLVL